MRQMEQMVRALRSERGSQGGLWEKWELGFVLKREVEFGKVNKKEGRLEANSKIWSPSLGFTNKWLSDLRQVIFKGSVSSSAKWSQLGPWEGRLGGGDYCAGGL